MNRQPNTGRLTPASRNVPGGQPRQALGDCHGRSGRGTQPSGTAHQGLAGDGSRSSHADPSASTKAPAARASANALQAGAQARIAHGSERGTGSLPVASSTPPPVTAKGQGAGESVPAGIRAIERTTREILSREQTLVSLREAAARIREEIQELCEERAAIDAALDSHRILHAESFGDARNEPLKHRTSSASALELMDLEDAEAAMAARRQS